MPSDRNEIQLQTGVVRPLNKQASDEFRFNVELDRFQLTEMSRPDPSRLRVACFAKVVRVRRACSSQYEKLAGYSEFGRIRVQRSIPRVSIAVREFVQERWGRASHAKLILAWKDAPQAERSGAERSSVCFGNGVSSVFYTKL